MPALASLRRRAPSEWEPQHQRPRDTRTQQGAAQGVLCAGQWPRRLTRSLAPQSHGSSRQQAHLEAAPRTTLLFSRAGLCEKVRCRNLLVLGSQCTDSVQGEIQPVVPVLRISSLSQALLLCWATAWGSRMPVCALHFFS